MKKLFDFLTKGGQSIALGISVVSIVIILAQVFLGLGSEGYEVSTDLNEILKNKDSVQTFDFFNMAIIIPIVLIVAIAVALVLFTVLGVVKFPKESLIGGAAFVVLLAVFGILYATAQHETSGKIVETMQQFNVGEGASKAISAGIKVTLGLAVLSAVAMIVGEVRNAFK